MSEFFIFFFQLGGGKVGENSSTNYLFPGVRGVGRLISDKVR